LSGCGNTPLVVETETVTVKVPVTVPLPDDLTKPCHKPDMPDPYLVGAEMDYVAALLTALAQCDIRFSEIQELQPDPLVE
jgi:hypothetical protein